MAVEAKEDSTTIIGASGRVAENIVSGLANAPTLLLIILLNLAMILAAAYFLAQMEKTRAATAAQIADLLRLCIARPATP